MPETWVNRVTFGVNEQAEAEVAHIGRNAFLNEQLTARDGSLPEPISRQIDALEITHLDVQTTLADLRAEHRRIASLPVGPEREQARRALNEHGNRLAYEAQRRELLRAIYSRAQLQEQLVAFWLNHFSVYQYKAELRWLVGDYAEHAIRPHALGRFRDLVIATLEHPAMLQYLDNAQNVVGHVNENYARELMELHTLGVNSGYTQQDVQALAHILTGSGVYSGQEPRLRREWQALYLHRGGFEFNPARHDFGDKVFLGARIRGSGFAEVEQAVERITHSDACAHFIAQRLAVYFVSDDPPTGLVNQLAVRFHATDGDIAAVMRELLASPEFEHAAGHQFKDPMHYVVSALRLAYDTRPIFNTHPVLNWLNALGEAPFNRATPDGYPVGEGMWASSGQLSRRFEIARAIGAGNAGLFEPEDGASPRATGFPRLANALYFQAIRPTLSPTTLAALNKANSQQEWNLLLLSSPEFNYR